MNSIIVKHWFDIPENYTGHIKWCNGSQLWLKNGKWHREDGPAVIWANGIQAWYKNNKLHRKDGPAIIRADGRQEWWLNGKNYTKEDYYKELCKRRIITEQELFVELL